jgi:hypothetical protein
MRRRQPPPERSPHLAALARAIHGIVSPFACGGSLRLDKPLSLRFQDGAEITVTPAKDEYQQNASNQALTERCTPARHGRGRQTRYDRSVRDALQLNAAGGTFSVPNFDPEASGVLDEIRQRLAPADPNPITAELYSLNVYQSRGHFVPHKDTPRGDDMLGTLVVCLPSHFSQGQLVASHHGAREVFDWGSEIERDPAPERVRWAAFFGDVDHSIERLWGGSRVTVSYILRRGKGAPARPLPPDDLFARTLDEALEDPAFLSAGDTLSVPCFHMYDHDPRFQKKLAPLTARTALSLKGRDLTVARAAIARGLQVILCPYLIEDCADERWELERFPTPTEITSLGWRLTSDHIKASLPVRLGFGWERDTALWVVPPPRFNSFPRVRMRDDHGHEIERPDTPAIEEIHACEYSSTGYFGNEGSDSRFYVYAALQIEVGPAGKRQTAERLGSAQAGSARKAAATVAPTKPRPSAAKATTKASTRAPTKKQPATKKEAPVKKWTWRF